jgi:hypothetical protein
MSVERKPDRTEKPAPVETMDQISTNIGEFNKSLYEQPKIQDRLSMFRSWFYCPVQDAVAPSKFVGYKEMTGDNYAKRDDLDGKETEPVLMKFFTELTPGTGEYEYVREKARQLTSGFGKSVNSRARFSAPNKQGGQNPVPRVALGESSRGPIGSPVPVDGESQAVVEMFIRAFSTLRPSEQAAVLHRIGQ